MSMNDYQIISKLGSGSFGIVYKAKDKKKGTVCVIKMVDIAKMDNKMKKNAMAEGKMLKQMNSPYIVKHFNTFISNSTLNIVMQYCPKGDLTNFLKAQMGKPVKEETIWKIALQMMIGMRDLHEKKILHRDIKAMNIFLDGDNNIRIGDLGVARVLKSDFAYTIVGTPYYLSPQMCQQKPYNEKTDIWAMGCVIYELCTGRHPFQANNQAALALKIVMGKYQKLPSHYSTDLSWVVQTCLSVDYKRRPSAGYLLTKSKIIEWAQKLNIVLTKEQKMEQKQIKIEKIEKVQVKKEIKVQAKKEEKPEIKMNKKESGNSSVQKQIKPSIHDKLLQNKQKKLSANRQAALENEKKYHSSKDKSKQKKILSRQKEKKQTTIGFYKNNKQNQKSPQNIPQIPNVPKKGVNKSTPNNKKPNLSYLNRFIPDDVKEKKIIDIEDKKRTEKVEIPDSDDSQEELPKKVTKKNTDSPTKNNKLLIIESAQKSVGDNELQEQFGITPSKKQGLVSLDLKKTKTINWDLEEEKTKENLPTQLPTIKTTSHMEPVNEFKIQEPSGDDIEIDEEIEDNQPYISDQESNTEIQELLIEDYEQQEVDFSKKIIENEKRKAQLMKLKTHFQGEILKKMQKGKYEELKKKLTSCSEDEVNEVVKVWNNIETINIFYRIIHFDHELIRCESNIEVIKQRLETVRKNK